MNYLNNNKVKIIFCYAVLLIVNFNQVTADAEEKSEEIVDGKSYENISSVEAGPPDSHEAMNNRMINPKLREKRSYEFLMGLINNNSKYEVTKVDPSEIARQPQSKIAASELLLDLMVKIAAHPDHWDKVHKLLQKIDRDLVTSKKIVNDLEYNTYNNKNNKEITNNKYNEVVPIFKKIEFTNNEDEEILNVTGQSKSTTTTTTISSNNKIWPTFDININNKELKNDNYKNPSPPYPKTFAYHRVTRRPSYQNKNPKAYIAVSVIAPKSYQDDELNLEDELHQLKPWIHRKLAKEPAP